MIDMVKFGPSGNDELFYAQGFKHTTDAFAWVKQMGLDLYEYSFGRGVLLKDETAQLYAELAKQNDLQISVHAPYFINLANQNEEAVSKSFGYIDKSLEKLVLMNGQKCVVHIGSCMDMDRAEAIERVSYNLQRFMDYFDEKYADKDIFVCPEAMGKFKQIGTYQEIIDLCTMHKCLIPTLDFGHINCILQGKLNNKDAYRRILDYLFEKLGDERARKLHVHFSKIEYSDKGEVKHLTLADDKFGPPFEPLAELLVEYKMDETTVICESKDIMAQDAKQLKTTYLSYCK